MKEVLKYNGKKALLKNCRKIKNQYYEKNVDCFLVEGKWNRIDNGLIFHDFVSKRWLRKSNYNLIKGFVDETQNVYDIIINEDIIRMSHNRAFLNENVAKLHGFIPSINSENYVKVGTKEKKLIGDSYGPLKYNITNSDISKLSVRYDSLFKSNYKNGILSRFLGDYTFGLEFETSNGYIRRKKLDKHGVIPLLDGSLRKPDGTEPFEFTTIPYSGVKGIDTVRSFCNVLNEHCEFDHSCSLHIHVGNFKVKNKTDILSLYKLLLDIQNDVFKMFPKYKENPEYIDKGKNYCNKLPSVVDLKALSDSEFNVNKDYNLSRIFKVLTNKNLDSNYNFKNGDDIFQGTSKWNIAGRYMWVNLIPLLFNTRKTIEFRIHEPTFNETHVVNWLLIIITILEYCKNNQSHILKNKVNFIDVLSSSIYRDKLIGYYGDRVNFYRKCSSASRYHDFYKNDFKII